MKKEYHLKKETKKRDNKETAVETYLAPAPPREGRVVGLDCHPDTFTAAVFVGQTPHDAKKIGSRENLSMEALMKWAAADLDEKDIILLEAGSNSFEVCKRLGELGLRTCVLESCHVGKHAKTYADSDKMAAARIALVYLAGNAPAVWVPDPQSRERRELLHAYNKAVSDHTAATNALKAYLNGRGLRLGNRSLEQAATSKWILQAHDWSALQQHLLEGHFADIAHVKARRKDLYQLIARQMSDEPQMLGCMKLLGVGIITGFGMLAVIGDIRRFASPQKLVAYIGLNPGQRVSGKGKNIRLGMGKRGRSDIRRLLIQGSQAILRTGRATPLGQWGWKLFARKGNRNIAVAAVARKLVVQIWHLLMGHPPQAQENHKSLDKKLRKLAVVIGSALRTQLDLGKSLEECVSILRQRIQAHPTAVIT